MTSRAFNDAANTLKAARSAQGLATSVVDVQNHLELYRQLLGGSTPVGDAILKAKAATKDNDVCRTWILFGDPTLRLR